MSGKLLILFLCNMLAHCKYLLDAKTKGIYLEIQSLKAVAFLSNGATKGLRFLDPIG